MPIKSIVIVGTIIYFPLDHAYDRFFISGCQEFEALLMSWGGPNVYKKPLLSWGGRMRSRLKLPKSANG